MPRSTSTGEPCNDKCSEKPPDRGIDKQSQSTVPVDERRGKQVHNGEDGNIEDRPGDLRTRIGRGDITRRERPSNECNPGNNQGHYNEGKPGTKRDFSQNPSRTS